MREITLISPKIAATTSKSNKPTNPQFKLPITTNTKTIQSKIFNFCIKYEHLRFAHLFLGKETIGFQDKDICASRICSSGTEGFRDKNIQI